MLTVLMLEGERRSGLWDFLEGRLPEWGSLLSLRPEKGGGARFWERRRPGEEPGGRDLGGPPDFLLCPLGEPGRLAAPGSVCLLPPEPECCPAGLAPGAPEGAFCLLLDSGSARALELAKESRLPALTCGLGSTDCFTFSSFGKEDRMFCLQRALPLPDGSRLEPFERPVVPREQVPLSYQLTLCALLTLSGIWPERE